MLASTFTYSFLREDNIMMEVRNLQYFIVPLPFLQEWNRNPVELDFFARYIYTNVHFCMLVFTII